MNSQVAGAALLMESRGYVKHGFWTGRDQRGMAGLALGMCFDIVGRRMVATSTGLCSGSMRIMTGKTDGLITGCGGGGHVKSGNGRVERFLRGPKQ